MVLFEISPGKKRKDVFLLPASLGKLSGVLVPRVCHGGAPSRDGPAVPAASAQLQPLAAFVGPGLTPWMRVVFSPFPTENPLSLPCWETLLPFFFLEWLPVANHACSSHPLAANGTLCFSQFEELAVLATVLLSPPIQLVCFGDEIQDSCLWLRWVELLSLMCHLTPQIQRRIQEKMNRGRSCKSCPQVINRLRVDGDAGDKTCYFVLCLTEQRGLFAFLWVRAEDLCFSITKADLCCWSLDTGPGPAIPSQMKLLG